MIKYNIECDHCGCEISKKETASPQRWDTMIKKAESPKGTYHIHMTFTRNSPEMLNQAPLQTPVDLCSACMSTLSYTAVMGGKWMTNKNPGCSKCFWYSCAKLPTWGNQLDSINDSCFNPDITTTRSYYWGDIEILGDPSEINKNRDCKHFKEGKWLKTDFTNMTFAGSVPPHTLRYQSTTQNHYIAAIVGLNSMG